MTTTPTDSKKLQAVTEAIQKACPELMELSLGCELECIEKQQGLKGHNIGDVVKVMSMSHGNRYFVNQRIVWGKKAEGCFKWIYGKYLDHFKILGHTPRLEHVLRAIEAQRIGGWQWVFLSTFELSVWCMEEPESIQVKIDLTKPPLEQPEVVSLLHKILCK